MKNNKLRHFSFLPFAGLAVILFFLLLCGQAGKAAPDDGNPGGISAVSAGTVIQNTAADFAAGTFAGTAAGAKEPVIELAGPRGKFAAGVYTSSVIRLAPFDEMVVSWNAVTPPGTWIKVEAQVAAGEQWSEWFSWGEWSTTTDTGSFLGNPKNSFADMDIDTLTLKSGKATAVRYRLTLHSDNPQLTPAVRLVAVTARDSQQRENSPSSFRLDKNLAVPMYSQGLRDPRISSRICSPTSLNMVLEYYGFYQTPEETAWGVMDYKGDLFGNWSFNTAYAGSLGLTSYVAFYNSLEDVKQEIARGYPVIASVRYRNSVTVAKTYPILTNAPISYTAGHIVVIRGFFYKDGKEYVLVNDPAAGNRPGVLREYLAEEFEEAWTKVAYVVHPGPAQPAAPRRIPAVLQAAGTVRQKDGILFRGYRLTAGSSLIDLSPGNIRSMVLQLPDGQESFIAPSADGMLWLNSRYEAGKYKLIIIANNHKIYET
ncbi:C39 family peptidase [Acetonema longum]|uniref:Peptidase C39-like domain-containing protein n=1 Tax=Acetonema longum DSM 6540 TaxID=1009370 RepID=F7NES8_9FIRM|nr:C39 family peptidase [Acetonema longum]EGO65489.1 hypothetical protein ALO_02716 [Acetonema longum DSM 6540]